MAPKVNTKKNWKTEVPGTQKMAEFIKQFSQYSVNGVNYPFRSDDCLDWWSCPTWDVCLAPWFLQLCKPAETWYNAALPGCSIWLSEFLSLHDTSWHNSSSFKVLLYRYHRTTFWRLFPHFRYGTSLICELTSNGSHPRTDTLYWFQLQMVHWWSTSMIHHNLRIRVPTSLNNRKPWSHKPWASHGRCGALKGRDHSRAWSEVPQDCRPAPGPAVGYLPRGVPWPARSWMELISPRDVWGMVEKRWFHPEDWIKNQITMFPSFMSWFLCLKSSFLGSKWNIMDIMTGRVMNNPRISGVVPNVFRPNQTSDHHQKTQDVFHHFLVGGFNSTEKY